MGKKKTPVVPTANPAQGVMDQAAGAFEATKTPSASEQKMGGMTDMFQKNYQDAAATNTADYGNIMGAYGDFRKNLGGPTTFSSQQIDPNTARPEELNESYGFMREAMPGYRDFASTGGYSDKDQQELRARGVSPIRAAYGNSMMELDRARSIGGAGGAPNYIAALSRAQRELPEQLSSATTNVNAGLADAIRQGKMFGLTGMTNSGQAMGGLSSAEAGRRLQALMANQGADLQAQGMTEGSRQNTAGMDLNAIQGQTGLYGSTPGMSSTFGSQALGAQGQQVAAEQNRNQYGLGLLGTQMQGHNMMAQQQMERERMEAEKEKNKTPWWKTALSIAGTIAPYALAPFTGGASLLGSKALIGGGMKALAPKLASGFLSR